MDVESCASSSSDVESQGHSERTLAIIKPEAFEDREAIEDHILDNGFQILAKRVVCLTPEQAAELYRGHYGRTHFPHLVAHISSGPIMAMVLAGKNALQRWITLIGPKRVTEAQAYWPESLRACYGRRTSYGDYFNGLHGSENRFEARREIRFFFPQMIVGPVLRDWQVKDYITKYLVPTLMPSLTELACERPAEPILWLANYLLKSNPNEPEFEPPEKEEKDEYRCRSPRFSEETSATSIGPHRDLEMERKRREAQKAKDNDPLGLDK